MLLRNLLEESLFYNNTNNGRLNQQKKNRRVALPHTEEIQINKKIAFRVQNSETDTNNQT